MKIAHTQIRDRLVEKGLKVTPQRIFVLEAIYTMQNHPTAEMIMDHIRDSLPGIASGTLYKVLDVLTKHGLIRRVKTEKDVMRYDGMLEKHHHLYCHETEVIEDYINEDLDRLLTDYFKNTKIDNFEIEDIILQIKGKFLK